MRSLISVVVPAYNEEENIAVLYKQLVDTFSKMAVKDFELVFVDDGSTDGTLKQLALLRARDKRVRAISFNKNQGKSAALSAGFTAAKGKTIITMDADLQDKPSEIPKLLGALGTHNDLVVGWRRKRKDSLGKRLPSLLFNFLASKLTGLPLHDFNCCFKTMRKEVTQKVRLYGEMHRYLPALAYWKGFRVAEVEVEHAERKFGKSKYGFTRLFTGLMDLITVKFLMTYTKRPLHFFGLAGVLSFALGFLFGLYLLWEKLHGALIGDRPLLILSVLLMVIGVQFVSLGLVAELIVSQQREVVEETVIAKEL